ncbi:MAG: TolC family protein, partial [Alistipes sp.]
EYTRIQLPPLHVLMQNARVRSPQVNIYDTNREAGEREVKTIRRRWLTYIKLNASYSYGSNDMTSQQYSNDNTQYPIVQNVTGTDQSWWNVGANIGLPLSEIFNRRNLIKQQQKRNESIQYETESWYDDVCLKIIEAYTSAEMCLGMIDNAASAMVTAKAQYEFSKTDFVNGKIDAQTLSRQKSIENVALREYEQTRAELNKALLSLEILSKTPILRSADQLDAAQPTQPTN